MAKFKVTCKEKHSLHERITAVGCINVATGSTHRFLEEDAIQRIEEGSDTFFTEDSKGERAVVKVGVREGRKYLTTNPDNTKADNLLALPDCPVKKPVPPGTIRTVAAAGSHSVPFTSYRGA